MLTMEVSSDGKEKAQERLVGHAAMEIIRKIDKKEEPRRFRGFQPCTPIISERESLRQSNGLCVAFSPFSSRTHSLFIYLYTILYTLPFQSIYSILYTKSDCLLYIRSKYISSRRREKYKAEFGSGVKKFIA